MNEKPPAKRKDLAKADLNFISKQPFEQVIRQLQDLGNEHIKPDIRQVDDDTAIFQLSYVRSDKRTAEVTGRLKRWAGDMTHIYCDGRIFKKRNIKSQLWRWVIDIPGLIALWFIILLFVTSGKNLSVSLSDLLLYTFTLSLIIFGLFHFARSMLKMISQSIMPETLQFRDQFISKPEAKDRERLFHAITSIIRDDTPEHILHDKSPDMKALSEEEEAALIEQITLEINQNRR